MPIQDIIDRLFSYYAKAGSAARISDTARSTPTEIAEDPLRGDFSVGIPFVHETFEGVALSEAVAKRQRLLQQYVAILQQKAFFLGIF